MIQKLTVLFLVLIQWSYAQVDFKKVDAYIEIDTIQRSVSGNVTYTFDVLNPVDSIVIDAQKMTFYDVKIDEKKILFTATDKYLILKNSPSKGTHTLTFEYYAVPKTSMYFIGWKKGVESQIWTQGQGKYTSNWFPSFDDVNEKLIFNISVLFDDKYSVISNGVLKKQEHKKDKILWNYQMDQPMSSYLLVLVVGKFEKDQLKSSTDIPIELYYHPKDKSKAIATYQHTKTVFDFFEKEIGIPYPWKIYRQIPLQDFIYAGMENTTSTTFSKEYMVDAIGANDQSFVNINAHELAHQWFGDLITAKNSTHHWLQEGFATYYALLAEQSVYGSDYFNWELFKYGIELQEASKHDTIPVLNGKASSLTFYKKGAWALHAIKNKIGATAFNKAIYNYILKNQFKSVDTEDFLTEIEAVSDFDKKLFYETWLQKSHFPSQEVFDILLKDNFIQQYLVIQKMRTTPLSVKNKIFKKMLNSDVFYPIKEEILYQIKDEEYIDKKKLLKVAIQQKEPHLDIAIALTTYDIPSEFKSEFENLLNSQSYKAREIALFKLWELFPEKANIYLEKVRGTEGLGDKNIELQWLYLSILTRDYKKIDFGTEVSKLVAYTQPVYESVIREKALEYCLKLKIVNFDTVTSLIEASTHHRWQFAKFAKTKLRYLLQEKTVREAVLEMKSDLGEKEWIQVEKILTELGFTTAR